MLCYKWAWVLLSVWRLCLNEGGLHSQLGSRTQGFSLHCCPCPNPCDWRNFLLARLGCPETQMQRGDEQPCSVRKLECNNIQILLGNPSWCAHEVTWSVQVNWQICQAPRVPRSDSRLVATLLRPLLVAQCLGNGTHSLSLIHCGDSFLKLCLGACQAALQQKPSNGNLSTHCLRASSIKWAWTGCAKYPVSVMWNRSAAGSPSQWRTPSSPTRCLLCRHLGDLLARPRCLAGNHGG